MSQVISVSELTRLVAGLLERSLPLISVGGEISNFTRAASGHWYFSIKDSAAQVRCVMFRGKSSAVDFLPKEGDRVEMRALATLYQARGDFQLSVEQLKRAGAGSLYEQFLRLQAKLQAEGLFDAERKRAIPSFVRSVGVVTSLQAAALRDVLACLERRSPHVRVVVYPCSVQGKEAPNEIVAALQKADQRARDLSETELVLLVRGGGAIEDLWSFNDESVARAIAAMSIPVICGVGHETDTTIADFVADLRAPTPTAAAELATPDREALLRNIEAALRIMRQTMYRQLSERQQALDMATSRLQLPSRQWGLRAQALSGLSDRLHRSLQARLQLDDVRLRNMQLRLRLPQIAPSALRLAGATQGLQRAFSMLSGHAAQRLSANVRALQLVGPAAVMARGYAIVKDSSGKVLKQSTQLAVGDEVHIAFADGSVGAQIQSKN